MDDRSLWKKELSFGRKPKDQKDGDDPNAPDEKPTSMWKKELSFKRKPKADAVEGDIAADSPLIEEPVIEEPVAEELIIEQPPAAESEVTEEPVWEKEVSFSQRISSYVKSVEAEPVVADDMAPPEDLSDSGLEPAAEEKVWQKEVSFSRKPEAEPVAEEAVAAPEDLSDPVLEPAAEEKVWQKEVSFSRKPEAEPVAEQPSADPLVAEEEPVAAEQAFAEEPSAVEEQVAEEPVATEALASLEVEAEPWNAPPSLPPAPIAEASTAIVPVPTPSVDVHLPVAAADLPPLADSAAKVPFWKKELSFRGKKPDKPDEAPTAIVPAPTPSVDVHPPVTAADLPPLADSAAKVPFWKKELSFGGKKRDKPDEAPTAIVPAPTPSADVHPPVAAADLPPLPDDAVKLPFWKKELSLGGKKRDKPVRERKQKPSKVKADRAPKTKEPKQPKEAKERNQKSPKVKVDRGSAKGRIVGLKIGASQLAAARVSNNGSAELLQVAREPLAPGIVVGGELRDPDALAEALKDFFGKHGLPKKGVRLGIANNRIGVRTFEIAGIEDPKQLANAIRFRAQETLPIPIDEAVLDHQILSEGVGEDGQPTRRVLLVVAYRELIDRYVDACKKAGITLAGIDLEAFALLRALQAPQEGVGTDATAALVVVAIGHERSTFAVSDGRVCEFTRVLEWGGSALNVAIARTVDAAPSEVEGAKRALALTDEMVPEGLTSDQAKNAREAMRRAIQTFARELVSSLQYYQNQPGSLGIGEIVLTGGTAHLPGISGELERLIGVHVRVGDPLARMKVSKKVGQPEQIGSLAVAIGLGIED
jgi:type IV pilus assembly protein PilM